MSHGAPRGPLTWVATPPPGGGPPHVAAPLRPYTGPPAYPAPPRWGFPQLTWRRPTSVPGTHPAGSGAERVAADAKSASSVLVLAAIAILLAAIGEIWRYVLLVRSRSEQLPPGTLITSDVWVTTASVLAIVLAVIGALLVLVWLYRARRVAAELSGAGPARPDWQVLLGLLPVINLFVPFSVLAELEHAALRRPADARPKPSRPLLYWWAAWGLSSLLFTTALLWPLRGTSMQDLADGVLLHAVLDLVSTAAAVLTALVVRRISALLGSVRPQGARYERVVRVAGVPDSRLRSPRPAGAPR